MFWSPVGRGQQDPSVLVALLLDELVFILKEEQNKGQTQVRLTSHRLMLSENTIVSSL